MISAIKDAVDMILEIEKKIKNNEIRDALTPIKLKVIEAKKENMRLFYSCEEEIIDLKYTHMKEMTSFSKARNNEIENLKESHKKKVSNLCEKIQKLEHQVAEQQRAIEKLSKKPSGPAPMILF
ncbi:MAG: hypothetical protein DHS20C09_10240 [marine bacterium B5-7]|jgi:predicted RNase H-like nuclease (RuvC/YqgF family)|nr:MAG: hypothetical protein DHS20C09_10240 [marine bacterium B5-7]